MRVRKQTSTCAVGQQSECPIGENPSVNKPHPPTTLQIPTHFRPPREQQANLGNCPRTRRPYPPASSDEGAQKVARAAAAVVRTTQRASKIIRNRADKYINVTLKSACQNQRRWRDQNYNDPHKRIQKSLLRANPTRRPAFYQAVALVYPRAVRRPWCCLYRAESLWRYIAHTVLLYLCNEVFKALAGWNAALFHLSLHHQIGSSQSCRDLEMLLSRSGSEVSCHGDASGYTVT